MSETLELIRRAGGGVVFEEFPGDLEDDAFELGEADADHPGEANRVTQRILIEEANRLAETLDRLRGGECSQE